MLQEKIESVYACDVYTFWENLYFLQDYGRAVYVDGLGFRRWEQLSLQDDGHCLSREIVLDKPLPDGIPKAVRKLAGESIVFTERGVFDRSKGEYELMLTNDRFANAAVRGWVTAEPHPDGCLRTVRLEISVNMFGIGKLVERTLLEAFASGYRDGVQYGNAFLAARPAPLQPTPTGPRANV